jgi:septum formation protein
VVEPEVEELTEGDPRDLVRENALRKARAAERAGTSAAPERVLGADTAVVLEGEPFGKPAGEREAEAFLERLSGRTHQVMTGIAVREPDGAERSDVAVTGEWRERAGGYAIQGRGAALVEEIHGDYWNVVGLPVAALLRLMPDLPAGR